jgi:hypothetical protein
MNTIRDRLIVVALMFAAVLASGLTPAEAAPASPPSISGVVFTGNTQAPIITISGFGFGANPPKAYPANQTSCGTYTDNGDWFGKTGSWFLDNTNTWQAGRGSALKNGNCIGVIVTSWTAQQVVFQFGNAYGTFDHWTVDDCDNYVLEIKGSLWGGEACYSPEGHNQPR